MTAEAARRLVLTKHHLLRRVDHADWRQIPQSLVGMHCARFKSPVFSLAARVDALSADQMTRSLYRATDMIKIRCMRGTLHIVPLSKAPVFHAATWRQRRSNCERLIRRCGVDGRDVDRVGAILSDVLVGARMTSLQIEAQAAQRGIASTMLVRAVLKLLWESGRLCYLNVSDEWSVEDRRYGWTAEWYGEPPPTIDEEEAELLLLGAYFASYGPASIADASWWSGLGPGRIRRAVSRMTDLLEVEVLGESGPHFIIASDLEISSASDAGEPLVRMLAYEDNLLKGYMPSRRRFVEPGDLVRVFNAIGEARATITIDGRVVGVWTWDDEASRPNPSVFRQLSVREKEILTVEVERLSSFVAAGP